MSNPLLSIATAWLNLPCTKRIEIHFSTKIRLFKSMWIISFERIIEKKEAKMLHWLSASICTQIEKKQQFKASTQWVCWEWIDRISEACVCVEFVTICWKCCILVEFINHIQKPKRKVASLFVPRCAPTCETSAKTLSSSVWRGHCMQKVEHKSIFVKR